MFIAKKMKSKPIKWTVVVEKWSEVEYSGITIKNRLGDCHMFMGKYQNSIDGKNRMIVPSKYRDELSYKCVLTKGIDKCLYIYPMAEWEHFMTKLAKLPSSDSNARAFVRHFYANAVECEIDRQGRMTIPQELREYANIDKELVTVGILDKIEIWSKAEWENTENGAQLEPNDFAAQMSSYGI